MSRQGSTRLLAAALCGLVLACALVASPAAALAARSEFQRELLQDTRIHDLRKDVDEHEKIIDYLLFPVTVLVGILSLGGAIGVVFSIRDQRRVSQLHELNVAGEMSSQRRTEQSYGSFFEQSQTTLSLVNETLQLAKEATAQAAKSMDEKAQVRVDAIEEKAQKVMLELFNKHEFDVVVVNAGRRRELQEIAKELRALEGYLSLQNIKLGHYTKFIKAIDQFIEGETEAALSELQLASQDPIVGDLQKFIEYWVGYILTTVGQYGEAIERFKHDELDLPETSSQYFQLERIIIETEFFLIAKPKPQNERDEESELADPRSPRDRFRAIASLLDRLEKLSRKLEEIGTKDEEAHTRLEVARTQADIYEWVAYDRKHLDDPIDREVVEEAKRIIESASEGEFEQVQTAAENPPSGKAKKFIDSPVWVRLEEGEAAEDLFRCWALLQAQKICSGWEKSSAEVAFALAECHFKLRDPRAAKEFNKADDELHEEMGEHREQRHEASVLQSLLICHCRLLKLQEIKEKEEKKEAEKEGTIPEDHQEENKEFRQKETGAIRATQREVLDAVRKMGRGRVTIFSEIQRRNLTQEEFRVEVNDIFNEMHLGEGEKTGPGDKGAVGAAEVS
jgi:tetratricopeptide (TPR) repeat protein